MSQKLNIALAVIGIDVGKNCFTLEASISAVQSCCGRSGHVAKWRRGLRTCPGA